MTVKLNGKPIRVEERPPRDHGWMIHTTIAGFAIFLILHILNMVSLSFFYLTPFPMIEVIWTWISARF